MMAPAQLLTHQDKSTEKHRTALLTAFSPAMVHYTKFFRMHRNMQVYFNFKTHWRNFEVISLHIIPYIGSVMDTIISYPQLSPNPVAFDKKF